MRVPNLLVIMLLSMLCASTMAQTPLNDPHWQLVWSDEFNGTDFNRNIWLVRDHWDHHGEAALRLDRPENAKVENGEAHLILRREDGGYSCPQEYIGEWHCTKQWSENEPYLFTTGGIWSKVMDFKYGYLESRISVAFSYGNWPAFWVWRNETNFSNANEIDVFEMDTRKGSHRMPTNIHLDYCHNHPGNAGTPFQCPNGEWVCSGIGGCAYAFGENTAVPYYPGTYRKYAIEWTPMTITWYVDDQVVRVAQNPGVNDAVRIILGNQMFADMATQSYMFHSSEFPAEMKVDYVKFYTLSSDCGNSINSCSYDLATHDDKVKYEIAIGGLGCSNAVANGDNVSLRATQGISLEGDFTVPLGASLYAGTGFCGGHGSFSSERLAIDSISTDGATVTAGGNSYDIDVTGRSITQEWVKGTDIDITSASAISETFDFQLYYEDPESGEPSAVLGSMIEP